MRNEENRTGQDLVNFIISFTDSNGEHHKDEEHHDQGETLQRAKEDSDITIQCKTKKVQNNINLPWMIRKQ